MTLAAAYSIAVLVILIGASRSSSARPFVVRNIRVIFWSAVAGLFSAQTILAVMQYRAWQTLEPQKFLLPPHAPVGYFLSYAGWKFFAPYALSLLIAGTFFFLARLYNRRHEEQFFYDEEPYFLALGLVLSGTPGWMLYALSMIVVAGAIIAFRTVILRRTDKFSFRELWLPVALFDILISVWVRALPGFELLHF